MAGEALHQWRVAETAVPRTGGRQCCEFGTRVTMARYATWWRRGTARCSKSSKRPSRSSTRPRQPQVLLPKEVLRTPGGRGPTTTGAARKAGTAMRVLLPKDVRTAGKTAGSGARAARKAGAPMAVLMTKDVRTAGRKTAAGRGARAARKAGAPMPKEMWTEGTEDGLQGTGAASWRQGGGADGLQGTGAASWRQGGGAAGLVLMCKGGKEGYGRRP